jgi:hypothetical protein
VRRTTIGRAGDEAANAIRAKLSEAGTIRQTAADVEEVRH